MSNNCANILNRISGTELGSDIHAQTIKVNCGVGVYHVGIHARYRFVGKCFSAVFEVLCSAVHFVSDFV